MVLVGGPGLVSAQATDAGFDTFHSPRVTLVLGDASRQAGPGAMAIARAAYEHAARSLDEAHVPYRPLSDSRLATHGVGPGKVVVFPYTRVLAEGEAQRLATWLGTGGHAIFVHALPAAAAKLLGLPQPRPVQVKMPGEYWRMVLPSGRILGLPPELTVTPKWVNLVDEPPAKAQRVGFFQTRAGRPQSAAPAYLTERGAYVACLLTKAEPREAGAFLRALAAYFAPELWDAVVPRTADALGPVEGAGSLGALLRFLRAQPQGQPRIERALRSAAAAEQARARARELLDRGLANAADDLASAARAEANRAYWMSWPSRKDELRGVWACDTAEPSWDAAAEALAQAHFTVVFPYMASAAAVFYPSSVAPAADGLAAGEDHLAEAVRACHAHGLKLHVRLLGLSCLFSTSATRQALAKAGRLMVGVDGKTRRWLCPTNPANRRQLVNLAVELVTKYHVDGLQLDYFRYPWKDVCTCPHCRAAFEQLLGRRTTDWPKCVSSSGPAHKLFLQFRRRQLDSLLEEMVTAVHKARPGLPVSAAVFVNWPTHRDSFGQDWVAWLKKGLINFACPMDYTASPEKFEDWASRQRSWAGDGAVLCYGLGPYADGIGDFSPLLLARQITTARQYGQGWVVFNLRRELLEDHLPRLMLGLCYGPARLPAWAGGQR
ncbi:MAG: family 10 glycosylhydrolase [Armatimonadetes bacterium]|nr:family 10 glycosylhydrolase [Armatimonadota bacterium]